MNVLSQWSTHSVSVRHSADKSFAYLAQKGSSIFNRQFAKSRLRYLTCSGLATLWLCYLLCETLQFNQLNLTYARAERTCQKCDTERGIGKGEIAGIKQRKLLPNTSKTRKICGSHSKRLKADEYIQNQVNCDCYMN